LRVSHRKLDPKKRTPYRPYHSHDELWPLDPDQVVQLDVEIWPTSIVLPKGYRGGPAATLSNMKNPMKGCGPFVHDDALDRPPTIFAGRTHSSLRTDPAPPFVAAAHLAEMRRSKASGWPPSRSKGARPRKPRRSKTSRQA
jgi:uncharacterized protein